MINQIVTGSDESLVIALYYVEAESIYYFAQRNTDKY